MFNGIELMFFKKIDKTAEQKIKIYKNSTEIFPEKKNLTQVSTHYFFSILYDTAFMSECKNAVTFRSTITFFKRII